MKILIIKLGYSETLVDDSSKVVSLGDVLRTTPIAEALHKKFTNANSSVEIIWLSSKEAFTLINKADFINQTIIYNDKSMQKTLKENIFDLVINLEKSNEIFAFLNKIKYKSLMGFIKNNDRLDISPENDKILNYIRENSGYRVWQELIFDMLGLKWRNEKYALGYKPSNKISHDVGLNYLVGSKWPQKAMSMGKWEELASLLTDLGVSFSWQEGKDNLEEYIEWINSCQTIITQDSLGMHIAMALQKRIIALFGPTNYMEIYPYDNTDIININWECKNPTMDSLNIQKIINLIKG